MSAALLLSPPVAAVIVLTACLLLSALVSRMAVRPKNTPDGARTTYACGENVQNPRLQPNYSEFFPFAFFFTILHVVALIVATAQTRTSDQVLIAVVYVAGAAIGLSILFRKGSADESAEQDHDLGED